MSSIVTCTIILYTTKTENNATNLNMKCQMIVRCISISEMLQG